MLTGLPLVDKHMVGKHCWQASCQTPFGHHEISPQHL
jgi:hypothetical protein